MASSSRPSAPSHISFEKSPYTISSTVSSPDSSYAASSPFHSRSASSGSADSPAAYQFPTEKKVSKNVYTHCGRHTDQYLFSGKGFTDIWKAVTKKE